VPAFQTSKSDLQSTLKEGGRATGGGRRRFLRSALVVADSLFGFALPEAIQAKFDEARARADAMEQSERVLGAWFRENEPERLHLYQALASFNETNRKTLGGTSVTYAPEKLAEGGLPVLFIVGQEDGLVPPELVHELASLIQGALVVEISEAGHSPYFEKPVEFNDSVLSFLQAFGGVRQSRAWLSNTAGYRKVD
jgi:pimeloyl-ACP methyl ester carboxylesterase